MPSHCLVRTLGFCVAALLLGAGCKPGADQLVPVKGKVSFRGVPLSGGLIVFTPDTARGGRGPIAQAEIQSDGSFTLKTKDAAGAAAGHHRVTIGCVQAPLPGSTAQPQPLIPSKYLYPEQSGLMCEVLVNKMNSIDFDLD